ncbi:hypothetical protein VCX83_22850, partial [Aeromonas caviae]|uniref:hypothetical protein n=1 Tax=Aeromonas caviae TaxID=648 RepID=UPI002B24AD68
SHAFPGVGFCLGEGQEIDWIGHTEYSETRIEQLDHIFNLIGITSINIAIQPVSLPFKRLYLSFSPG